MKRYYICEAVQYIEPVNGKSEKFAMVGRDTENEALIVYHDKMSAARKDENVAIEIVHVMDEKGGDIKQIALRERSLSLNLKRRHRKS